MPAALNLLVFREDRQRVCGPELKAALARLLPNHGAWGTPDDILAALLRAGELECAVADSPEAVSIQPYMSVTDRLAEALVSLDAATDFSSLIAALAEAAIPEALYISPPEGFAYYALHPLAYSDVLAKIPGLDAHVVIVGVRTIGATLSAVTLAAARARGLAAERVTVRPHGHPYNRRMKFSPCQVDFIRQHAARDACFLVVDEGPGLSGSTFISVAEALMKVGAPRERITLVCAHEPDFDSMRAENGPCRARRLRWIAVSSEPRRPPAAEAFIGGGQWRRHLLPLEASWPPAWTSLERLKYLSADQSTNRRLFKFLGFGHYGERVCVRERQIADAGYGPAPRREALGFASYPWIAGRSMNSVDLSTEVLVRLAAYCAFRVEVLACNPVRLDILEHMAEHNANQLGLDAPTQLRLERPVLADGRMQPHEWVLAADGQMLKTDSGCHGDDHFFPGVTDIAWDLAGAIVEWSMTHPQAEAFLEAYRRASGDDPCSRIPAFITAYALFRSVYCRMAANALPCAEERARLYHAASRYLGLLSRRSPDGPLVSSC
ncbi:MAG TPA: hypothetical protein VIX19_14770 [Terriglobales bacterium]